MTPSSPFLSIPSYLWRPIWMDGNIPPPRGHVPILRTVLQPLSLSFDRFTGFQVASLEANKSLKLARDWRLPLKLLMLASVGRFLQRGAFAVSCSPRHVLDVSLSIWRTRLFSLKPAVHSCKRRAPGESCTASIFGLLVHLASLNSL